MAKFYEGITYKIEKDYHKIADKETIVFTVDNIYMDGKTKRAAGPTLYHIIGDMLYVNGHTDIIPEAYTKDRDRWEEISPQKARHETIEWIFEGNFKFIQIKENG